MNDASTTSIITLSKPFHNTVRPIQLENNIVETAFIIKTIGTMLAKYENVKEQFYINGIKNLRKRINFMQLNSEFQNGDISTEEYEKELENNEDKYVVDVKLLNTGYELMMLNEVINKIGNDLTVDEVADIFSIDLESFETLKRLS